jgi:hypothetical protein
MYRHTESGSGLVILLLVSAVVPVLLLFLYSGPDAAMPRVVVAFAVVVLLVCALTFRSLTVAVEGGRLRWHFGSGFPRGSVAVADIVSAERAKTSMVQGIGIHWTRRGWLYNVAASGAVHLELRGGRQLLLGTDEPEALIQAIRSAQAA